MLFAKAFDRTALKNRVDLHVPRAGDFARVREKGDDRMLGRLVWGWFVRCHAVSSDKVAKAVAWSLVGRSEDAAKSPSCIDGP
jgi:hypothetical protein